MNLRDKVKLITKFESLTDAEKETVPDDSYRRVTYSVKMRSKINTGE